MSNPAVDLKEIEPGIIQITMQDRESKNTFSKELILGLVDAFKEIEKRETAKAVILTGFDTYFASGGTQEALLSIYEGNVKFTDINIYSLALDCKIPVISAMQGHGIGGGFVMGLFADFIILSRESVYTTNFMRYGFTPGMGATYILPTKLGITLAEEMLLGAENYRGEDLKLRGISFPVLPRVEVLPYAIEFARKLAAKPRISLITLKSHLVKKIRAELPHIIQEEVEMHELTFHQEEVKANIQRLFGK